MDTDKIGARQRGIEIRDRLAAGGLDLGGQLLRIGTQT